MTAPGFAANVAARLWFRIPKARVSDEAQNVLATGTRFEVDVNGVRVVGWRWGQGSGSPVILVHGWGGYAGQLYAFVQPLVTAGHEVITFDAPSHGDSGPSELGPRHATLFEFAEALFQITRHEKQIAGVVAHSGGCAAVAWTLATHPDWRPAKLVFIAPFGRPAHYMALFQRTLGLSDRAMQLFRENTERRFHFRWVDLEVPAIADRVKTPPLLVVHDREDRETSFDDGAAIAAKWPNSQLQPTTGLGHNRILRDSVTIDAAVRFVSSR